MPKVVDIPKELVVDDNDYLNQLGHYRTQQHVLSYIDDQEKKVVRYCKNHSTCKHAGYPVSVQSVTCIVFDYNTLIRLSKNTAHDDFFESLSEESLIMRIKAQEKIRRMQAESMVNDKY